MAEHFSWGEFLPLAGASVAISVTGLTVAVLAYALRRIDLGELVAARFPTINAFLANKWYLDAINEKLFVRSSRKLAREVLEVDAKVVDGVVNLTGLLTLGSGEGLNRCIAHSAYDGIERRQIKILLLLNWYAHIFGH